MSIKTFRTKLTALACGLALAFAPASHAQGPAKPVAVIAFSGYDELLADVDFLGSLAQMPNASQTIQGIVTGMTGGQGLQGLDAAQPIGVIVQHDGVSPSGAICLPITDLNKLLGIVANFGVTSEAGPNGLTVIKAQGQSIFAKTSGKWALLSMAPQMLEGAPADPGAVFAPLVAEYDLAVSVNVQNVPPEMRQSGVEMFSQSARAGLHKNDGESDEAFELRKKQIEVQLEEIQRVANELDTITIGLAVDDEEKRAYLDVIYSAVAGTTLAEQLAAYSNTTTNFAGFFQPEAALSMSFAMGSMNNPAQVEQGISTIRQMVEKGVDGEEWIKSPENKAAIKEGANELLDALETMATSKKQDGGAVLSMEPGSLTFVFGAHIDDPSKVESGLKKIAEASAKEDPKQPEVAWSSASHGDVTYHTFSVPLPEDDSELRSLVGDQVDVAVGIGKESVYFALGRNCVEETNAIIDASAKSPGKAIAPMEATISLAQIMTVAKDFAEADKKPHLQMIVDMLANEANGRDHIRIVSQNTEQGLRTRFEAEEGVLRAIGMGAMAAQMQAAGAR